MVIFKTLKNRTSLKSSLSDTIGLKKDSVEKMFFSSISLLVVSIAFYTFAQRER